MRKKPDSDFSPPAVGGVSLLVVFAVLCLTVFALLSLSTVRADARLSEASAQSVADYYAADCEAQKNTRAAAYRRSAGRRYDGGRRRPLRLPDFRHPNPSRRSALRRKRRVYRPALAGRLPRRVGRRLRTRPLGWRGFLTLECSPTVTTLLLS